MSDALRNLSDLHRNEGPFVAFVEPGHNPTGTLYSNPLDIVIAQSLDAVGPSFETLSMHVSAGRTVAGFVSYEAGASFEDAMPHRKLDDTPYLWFGVFEASEQIRFGERSAANMPDLQPAYDESEYRVRAERVRDYIGAGDSYQVNLTFPVRAELDHDPLDLFIALAAANPSATYRTYIDTGETQLLSLSPELFFELDGARLVTRPMKGTIARGADCCRDAAQRRDLLESTKERAENLMIVDLLRNDVGRVSETGTVKVESLFDTERFDRVWQMTSTISAQTRSSVPEIFAALFPSGSVTGAPKIRTMQIIDELEPNARGPYCGAIGWWGSDRAARFSVGIRTAQVFGRDSLRYSVGSGITWDARPETEYRECLLKAASVFSRNLTAPLFETIRLDGGDYALLDRHIVRLRASADYFGIAFDEGRAREALDDTRQLHHSGVYRVRLTLGVDGGISIAVTTLEPHGSFRVCWSDEPVDSARVSLYHKTTDRSVYTAAKNGRDGVDDVLMWNVRGEATESTIANLVVEIGGELLTPPVASGLLPGVFRDVLIARGVIREQTLTRAEVEESDQIWLINSLRGWISVTIADHAVSASVHDALDPSVVPSTTLVS